MNIEEVQEPETTKIYRQNPLPSVADTRKLRKFTDETNMQARNHENSDEICAQPVCHLDLSTPAFTITVRTPSVTTLFGELEVLHMFSRQLNFIIKIAFIFDLHERTPNRLGSTNFILGNLQNVLVFQTTRYLIPM